MSKEQDIFSHIAGHEIVDQLSDLAAIGGISHRSTTDHPVHSGSNRLALSVLDRQARDGLIKPMMIEAGMDIIGDHPLALVGRYPGSRPDLEPVMIISHIDTVPDGDIYDGVLGVVGGIATVKAMDLEGLVASRDIIVAAVTGEESSGFNFALFGSRALFQGLTEDELGSHKPGKPTIAGVLGDNDTQRVKSPAFGPNGGEFPTAYASIELHVEQDRKLIDAGNDLGIVEKIAAPVRYSAKIGSEALKPETSPFEYNQYLELQVEGSADHSGATPMGDKNRADGLLEVAKILDELIGVTDEGSMISAGSIEVTQQAMNKVPGLVAAKLRIAANSEQSIEDVSAEISEVVEAFNFIHANTEDKFNSKPLKLTVINESEAGDFFNHDEMVSRQKTAFSLIRVVNKAAIDHADQKCVGTVATIDTSVSGVISLGVDLRGMTLEPRDAMVAQIQNDMDSAEYQYEEYEGLGVVLPGSGDSPVTLSKDLVDKATEVVALSLPDVVFKKMDSAAGHDTQNVARAGIPAVMIFAQSKDGIAHNPDAYTSPHNIDKAVKALAALTIKLANEVPEETTPPNA